MSTQTNGQTQTQKQTHKQTGRRGMLALVLLFGAALAGSAWAAPGGHGGGGHGGFHGGGFHGGGFHGGFHGAPAHFHGGGHVGVWIGAPWGYGYGPGWYGDPWYGYPYQGTIVVQQPPVYVDQGGTQIAPASYYCDNPQGYYPAVQNCNTTWRAVQPVAPAQ